jgi:hypothetical protein
MKRDRRFAAAGAALILAVLFTASMTWGGAPAEVTVETGQPIPPPASPPSPAPAETPLPEADVPEIKPYEPDAMEVEALARMLYGEARGVPSTMEKAACVWCVLNRVDDPRFPDTVLEVLEAPYQFAGYKAEYPVLPELAEIAADVLTRYHAERDGDTEAGRVLPAEYAFFTGDGRNNHFFSEWKGTSAYDWTLINPYDD